MTKNKRTQNLKEAGITLVALVVTIIILLILVTVSISLVINNGILDKAKSAVDKYSEGEIEEQMKLAYTEWKMAKLTGTTENASGSIKSRLDKIYNNIEEVEVDNEKIDVTIEKNGQTYSYKYYINSGTVNKSYKDYVGYYADIDADGTVDGVIFADLLMGNTKQNKWGNVNIEPTINIEQSKKYYISKKNFEGEFGIKDVLSPQTNTGKERFYIMQLTNFTTPSYTDPIDNTNSYPEYTAYTWYKNAEGKMNPVVTLNDFGKGKENTKNMIIKWNEGYPQSPQDNKDIWKHIETKYNGGWFLPSINEWIVFANELEITATNYSSTYGLSDIYWSSSQGNATYIHVPFYKQGIISARTRIWSLFYSFSHNFLIFKKQARILVCF